MQFTQVKVLESIARELGRIATALESRNETVTESWPTEPAPEKKPRAKKEKPPEPESFPDEPTPAPELKMSDLVMGDVVKSEPVPFSITDLKAELTKLKAEKGVAAIADLFSRFGLKHINDIKESQIGEIMAFIKAVA
jgi:hypothetical protein